MFKVLGSVVLVLTLLVVGGLWYFSKDVASVAVPVAADNSLEVKTASVALQTSTSTVGSLDVATSTNTNIDVNKKYMNAILHTNKGDITILFSDKEVPNTVANFIKLAKTNFYDGVKFHRVIKGFMIQGGDPLTKDDSKKAIWGTGGPGYSFADELTPDNKNDVGTISMANAGPNTNGSQFFINVAPNNFLDKKHVVFGHVTAGMDIVKAIESTPVDANDRPVAPVIIQSITLK